MQSLLLLFLLLTNAAFAQNNGLSESVDKMISDADLELSQAWNEVAETFKSAIRLRPKCPVVKLPIIHDYTNNLISNLLENSNLKGREKDDWGFCLIVYPSAHINEVQLKHDGTLWVPSSLYLAVKSESELAYIIGHEISHHLLHHSALRKWKIKTDYGSAYNWPGNPKHDIDKETSYIQRLESDADKLAQYLILKAGFNKNASINILKRIGFVDEDDHPSTRDRIKLLKGVNSEIESLEYRPTKNLTDDFDNIRNEIKVIHKEFGIKKPLLKRWIRNLV